MVRLSPGLRPPNSGACPAAYAVLLEMRNSKTTQTYYESCSQISGMSAPLVASVALTEVGQHWSLHTLTTDFTMSSYHN